MRPVPLDTGRCEEIDARVSELLDGELDPAAVRAVELHLAVCAPCARRAEQLRAVIRALHRLGRRGAAPPTVTGEPPR